MLTGDFLIKKRANKVVQTGRSPDNKREQPILLILPNRMSKCENQIKIFLTPESNRHLVPMDPSEHLKNTSSRMVAVDRTLFDAGMRRQTAIFVQLRNISTIPYNNIIE